MTAEAKVQCVLIGDIGIGKSSLISRYVEDRFPAPVSVHQDSVVKFQLDDDTQIKMEICEG